MFNVFILIEMTQHPLLRSVKNVIAACTDAAQ
jgi:hypothetical protein